MGGFPRLLNCSATRTLMAFVTAAAPIVDPGPTASTNPGTFTKASPPGVQLSMITSAILINFFPLLCNGIDALQ